MRTFARKQGQPHEPAPSSLSPRKTQPSIGNQAMLRRLRKGAEDLAPIPTSHPGAGTIPIKLAINKAGDEYEQEADLVSERMMRRQPRQLQRACSCGGEAPERQTENLDQDPERLQSKRVESSDWAQVSAPPVVHDVLRSAGQPLDPAVRSLMGLRFGVDFSDVRIHTGATAAESALAVNALAYTVGRNVVFGANQYQPDTSDGRRLLAHELAHVVQQNQAPIFAVQRACRSAAQCAAPAPGNASQFGADVEAESEAIAVASGGVPAVVGGHASCNLPRHGQRATNLEALATGAGLGATIAPGIDGFFINACLSPRDGANNSPCSEFPGGPPAHTHPGQHCVQMHTTDEDRATALLARPRPLGDADLRQLLWFVSTVVHESEHNRFDANAAAIVPPAADCNVNTPVSRGTVESLLSEISAEIAEFNVYFLNSIANPSRSSAFAMQSEEHEIAIRGGENILGNIKDLQCVCECGTVATFIQEVFNEASASWTPEARREFKRAMTAFIPSFWPPSLHQR